MVATSESKKEGPKEIDKLIDFLEDFTNETEDNKKNTHLKLHGHLVWKEKDKRDKQKKQDNSNANDRTTTESFKFNTTDFLFRDKVRKDIANTIKDKLSDIKKHKEEEEFQVNKRLPSDSYGYQNSWGKSYNALFSYIDVLSNSSTSTDKKGLLKENKNSEKRNQDISSFTIRFLKNTGNGNEELIFIKLLNLKHALSKSKRKIILNLDQLSNSQSLVDSVIIEPDNFDCAVFGDKLFVFHPVNFYYLFVPTDILKESILEKREEIGETISDPDMLISAANRPSKVRDLYYFVSQGSKIPEKEEIKKDLEILNQYGVKEKLFSITEDNKITCTEENASLVLSYISKKLGLRISDKRLLNVEASSQL